MGHVRLGRLPKSKRWQAVVGLMESDAGSASRIAAATLLASEAYLRTLGADSAVVRAYGLLVGLMTAARQGEFAAEAARLGLRGEAGTSSLAFLASVADVARSGAAAEADGSQAGEFAALALRRALMDTVATQSVGLFGSTVEDLQRAFRAHSTERQFGEVSRLFFGDFVSRVLQSALDREAPGRLGVAGSSDLLREVDLHARESAVIVRDFAGEWLSKKQFERGDAGITRQDVAGFVAVALRKLRSEIKREGEEG